MEAKQILHAIEAVRNESGKNKKVEILKSFDCEELRLVLELTYNPYMLYYTRSITASQHHAYIYQFLGGLLTTLKQMANNREGLKKFLSNCEQTLDEEQLTLFNLILARDLDAGFGASTINKAFPDMKIPDYKVGKAEEQGKLKKNITFPAYLNVKIDGARATAFYDNGAIEVKASSGRVLEQIPSKLQGDMDEIAHYIGLNKFVVDGEFMHEVEKRAKSNGVFNKMLKGTASTELCENMKFHAFDLLRFDTFENGIDPTPLIERIELFDKAVKYNSFDCIIPVAYEVVNSAEEAEALSDEIIAMGEEGTIIKNIHDPYECKRQKGWVKIKMAIDIDAEIYGWTPHSKREDLIGSILIRSSDGIITSGIGTGKYLTEERRKELKVIADNDDLVGRILQCTIHTVTKNEKGEYAFNLPRIEEERHDTTADSFEKIMDMIPEPHRP